MMNRSQKSFFALVFSTVLFQGIVSVSCFLLPNSPLQIPSIHERNLVGRRSILRNSMKENNDNDAEEITKKYGLEAGLYNIFANKGNKKDDQVETIKLNQNKEGQIVSKGAQAKELLAKYGGAYLATSISLAIVSFTICYLLVDNGVDVASLLAKVGIAPSDTSEKAGTAAIAYAAHKAASPIRFPPTVALTPVVANWMGKKVDNDDVIDEQEM